MQIWKQELSHAVKTNSCCGSRLRIRRQHHGHDIFQMMKLWQHGKRNGCISMPDGVTTFLGFCLCSWTCRCESITEQLRTTKHMAYTLEALAEFRVLKSMKKTLRN
eukprot:11041363-Karenia_brevis.AAC.1